MRDWPTSTHMMVDLETLSVRPNAAIVSIGAVCFTFKDGIINEFTMNVDPKDCKVHGLRIDKDTVDWWMTQSKEARASWATNPRPLKEMVDTFHEFFRQGNPKYFWSHGASFDEPVLGNAIKMFYPETPWKFYNARCTRTVFDMAGINLSKERENRKDLLYHNALSDTKFQVEMLLKALNQ